MKIKTLVLGLTLLPFAALAQSANISRTDMGPSTTSANLTTGLQNAQTSTFFQNDGETLLAIRGGGTAVTATIKTQKDSLSKEGYGTVALTDQVVSIPSATLIIAGPFPTGRWNTTAGTVGVSMSAVTGVSATALRVKN
jgi:hypothetical protein